ncbi:MAG: uncharacterized protein JWM78_283 [Verrucomicrobiaceae bacterium]|nr:uncharacterized protein [Verrucomicrobiaceae bacterium]
MSHSITRVLGFIGIFIFAVPVFADPPARVGRISYIEGKASFSAGHASAENADDDANRDDADQAGANQESANRDNVDRDSTDRGSANQSGAADDDQWSDATLNYPITTGDSLWTEPNARLELQIGSAEVRMDHSTEFNVVQLDDDATQLRVDQGVINVHLHAVPTGGISVITPQGRIDLVKPGSYHIDAGYPPADEVTDNNAGQNNSSANNDDLQNSKVRITTLEGEAQINEARAHLVILPGEGAVIGGDPVNYTLIEDNATPFDDWALAREHRESAAESTRYVSPETTGYEDLDRNGQWVRDSDNGTVWYPAAVAVDWAPYRYGHWAYVGPWGWTWIDDASWGFAPFHYGRWVRVHERWGWCPGAIAPRPVYAPALVAFVGGVHGSVSIGIGATRGPVGFHWDRANRFIPITGRARITSATSTLRTSIKRSSITSPSIRFSRGILPINMPRQWYRRKPSRMRDRFAVR